MIDILQINFPEELENQFLYPSLDGLTHDQQKEWEAIEKRAAFNLERLEQSRVNRQEELENQHPFGVPYRVLNRHQADLNKIAYRYVYEHMTDIQNFTLKHRLPSKDWLTNEIYPPDIERCEQYDQYVAEQRKKAKGKNWPKVDYSSVEEIDHYYVVYPYRNSPESYQLDDLSDLAQYLKEYGDDYIYAVQEYDHTGLTLSIKLEPADNVINAIIKHYADKAYDR